MKISVIIPVYNVAKYIERCLLSVLNQTWQDLEVILVDDCTPDNSMEIAYQVVGSHPRGTVVKFLEHEKNRGLSAARNTGIDTASGDYLYFLDSDDYIPIDALLNLGEVISENTVDFVIGNYEVVGAKHWAPPLLLSTGVVEGNRQILSAYVKYEWYVMAWNKLVNRHFLIQHKLYFQEGLVHEDDLWSFKLASTAQNMSIVNVVTYYYYMQPDSIMRSPSIYNLKCRVRLVALLYNYITESRTLSKEKLIIIFFERTKARYFDKILYSSKDVAFHYQSYCSFRMKKYVSNFGAIYYMGLDIKQALLNIHYLLPLKMGYYYYKGLIKLFYYFEIFHIKLMQFLTKDR